jgi:alanyl-tRNA synthetase
MLARVLEGVPAKELRGLVDEGKKSIGSGVIAYVGVDGGRAALAIGVTDDLKTKISAVDLLKAGVAAVGGQGGGGRPDMAQGGGPDGAAAPKALDAIRAALQGALAA